VTPDEFFKKWIRFTYIFYYRHLYMPLLMKKVGKVTAKIINNMAQAVMTELLMFMILQKCHGYFFVAFVISLIWELFQDNYPPFSPDRSNAVILFGYLLCFPLILTYYTYAYWHY